MLPVAPGELRHVLKSVLRAAESYVYARAEPPDLLQAAMVGTRSGGSLDLTESPFFEQSTERVEA